MKGIVTTAGRTNAFKNKTAKDLASKWSLDFVERNKCSINQLVEKHGAPIYVVQANRVEVYFSSGGNPFFYHPNLALVRAKRWLRGEKDYLIDAAQLEAGDSFADMTLGLASDALMASLVVGSKGRVSGVEISIDCARIIELGLSEFNFSLDELNVASRRIQVYADHHLKWLKKQEDNSWDIVYFDPMFMKTIEEASGLDALKEMASFHDLSHDTIEEAKRVASKRVVMKDSFRSARFEAFNFRVLPRPSSKVHFGYIIMS